MRGVHGMSVLQSPKELDGQHLPPSDQRPRQNAASPGVQEVPLEVHFQRNGPEYRTTKDAAEGLQTSWTTSRAKSAVRRGQHRSRNSYPFRTALTNHGCVPKTPDQLGCREFTRIRRMLRACRTAWHTLNKSPNEASEAVCLRIEKELREDLATYLKAFKPEITPPTASLAPEENQWQLRLIKRRLKALGQ